MEGRSLPLVFLFSAIANFQFTACLPSIQAPETVNLLDNYSHLLTAAKSGNAMETKCNRNGGKDAYNHFVASVRDFEACVGRLITPSEFSRDVQELSPNGNYASVIGKYCTKLPALKACMIKGIAALEKCEDEWEKTALNNFVIVSDSASNYVCFNGGSGLASLIRDGGVECARERILGIGVCWFALNFKYPYPPIWDWESLNIWPLLKLGQQECRAVQSYQQCLVGELKKCRSLTAANFQQALYDYVIKQSPCHN